MELTLKQLYEKMKDNMGNIGWWPAESKEEIIVGAIMIQNTNWRNAERAVDLFREKTRFDPQVLASLSLEELEEMARPAGFYKNKSKSIHEVFNWLSQWNYNYQQIKDELGPNLRAELISLRGIGDETADVLLGQIFEVPAFVSDKYARTLFTLLGVEGLNTYRDLAQKVNLGTDFTGVDAQLFHGLIDEFGKEYFHPLDNFHQSFLAGDRLSL